MLRFAMITLSNPAKPHVKPMEFKAIVTDGDFGLAIGSNIAAKLELEQIDLRSVAEAGKPSPYLVPYVGPLRVTCGGKDVFTGALNCINGVAIGAQVAKELHLDTKVQMGEGVGEGLVPFGLAPQAESKESLAKKILIKENVVDKVICQKICDFVREQKRNKTGVEAVAKSIMPGAESYKQGRDHARDAFYIETQTIEPMLGELFHKLVTQHIMPFFGIAIESWERPQLLSYEKGGKYEPHADGESKVDKPGGKKIWQRVHNRDVSILLYLNDEFTGGNLRFPDFNITITPKPGLLVSFPSTGDYVHGAEPTESGDRMLLVTWAAIEGTARMMEEGNHSVYRKSFE